jgi:hypothetical protein
MNRPIDDRRIELMLSNLLRFGVLCRSLFCGLPFTSALQFEPANYSVFRGGGALFILRDYFQPTIRAASIIQFSLLPDRHASRARNLIFSFIGFVIRARLPPLSAHSYRARHCCCTA